MLLEDLVWKRERELWEGLEEDKEQTYWVTFEEISPTR